MYLKRKWANLLWKLRDGRRKIIGPHLPPPQLTDRELLNLGQPEFASLDSLLSHFQNDQSYFISRNNKTVYPEFIRQHYPLAEAVILPQADRICQHIFDILGCKNVQLPPSIPWNSDFRLNKSWSGYYLRIDAENLDVETDIRFPWELSRCQHWVTLGQAYWLSRDEKYALEFTAQLGNWLAANPTDWGINWICSMEVAIRALNWVFSYYLFLDSPHFTSQLQIDLIKSLVLHARHIQANLEGHPYGQFGNHYITNGLGLLGLGIFFRRLQPGPGWIKSGLDILWREALKQVYPDGVDYEGSINYHREVTEFLLAAIVLCRKNNLPVPEAVSGRVERMLEFIAAYSRPDGSTPMIGDSDNGRLFVFEPGQPENNHRSTLSTGAAVFGRADLARMSGKFHLESLWWLGPEGYHEFRQLRESAGDGPDMAGSRAFDDGGFYIMRSRDIHLALRCGPYGPHGHNDILGLDLFACNQPVIVDSGTYMYTGDWKQRNQFRSVYSHATVVVDGQEPHPLSKSTMWRVGGENRYALRHWDSQAGCDVWEAEHYCYRRLNVIHRRRVMLNKDNQYVLLQDTLSSQGEHDLEFIFPLAPQWQPEIGDNALIRLQMAAPAGKFYIVPVGENVRRLTPRVEAGWVSYLYGQKIPSRKVVFQARVNLPFTVTFRLSANVKP